MEVHRDETGRDGGSHRRRQPINPHSHVNKKRHQSQTIGTAPRDAGHPDAERHEGTSGRQQRGFHAYRTGA